MAYTDNKRPADRAASVAGVIAVHAALGYALVVGLQFTGVIPAEDPPFEGTTVVEPLPLPPPPKPTPDAKTPTDSKVYTPPTTFTLNDSDNSEIDTTDLFPPPGDIVLKPAPGLTLIPKPGPPPAPAFDPVSAKARNDPARWITESDYKTSWINREMMGTAGFRLSIGADGQVEGCQITRSTGHTALDEATCALVTRRAKFDPARDSAGEKTAGTYTSSVRWQIPE